MNQIVDICKNFPVEIYSSTHNISTNQYLYYPKIKTDHRSSGERIKHTDVLLSKNHKIRNAIDRNSSITSSLSHQMPFASKSLKSNSEDFDWINNQNPYDRIVNMRGLPDNWDGYGASKFSYSQIQRCERIYFTFVQYSFRLKDNYYNIQPFVAPCSDGAVLFEWSGTRFPIRQLELTIPADEKKCISFFKSSESYEQEEEVMDTTMLKPLFDWLFNLNK